MAYNEFEVIRMKELLKKIIDQRSNGLYFVNTPTGSAKSYSAV